MDLYTGGAGGAAALRRLGAAAEPGCNTTNPDGAAHEADSKLLPTVIIIEGLAVWLSVMVGQLLHRHHLTRYLPESAATVMVGLLVGGAVRLGHAHLVDSSEALEDSVGFGNEVFSLVLLPIIIFESGFSLRKRFFFHNLPSITAYAVLGTVISALVIGVIVWGAGVAGSSVPMGWAEAFTLASLLSATDPVATLSTFSALKVEPTLNALVYGESVLNDAVGIVLFRTFASWIGPNVSVSPLDVGLGIGLFLGILVGSAVMGLACGFIMTLVFRVTHLGWVPCACLCRSRRKVLLGAAGGHSGGQHGKGRGGPGGKLEAAVLGHIRAAQLQDTPSSTTAAAVAADQHAVAVEAGSSESFGGSSHPTSAPMPSPSPGGSAPLGGATADGQGAGQQLWRDRSHRGASGSGRRGSLAANGPLPSLEAADAGELSSVGPVTLTFEGSGVEGGSSDGSMAGRVSFNPLGVAAAEAAAGGGAATAADEQAAPLALFRPSRPQPQPLPPLQQRVKAEAVVTGEEEQVGRAGEVTAAVGRPELGAIPSTPTKQALPVVVVSSPLAGQAGTLPLPSSSFSSPYTLPATPSTPGKEREREGQGQGDGHAQPIEPYDDSDAFVQSISILIFCYASYLSAEAVGLSGIVSALFAGLHCNHFTRIIMPKHAQRFSAGLLKTLASLADTAVFCTIGLDVASSTINPAGLLYDSRLIGVTIVACLVGRAANVFPISACLNRGRKDAIPLNYQALMWHAGLRGAIAYASASAFPSPDPTLNRQLKGTTAAVVMFTLVSMGCTCELGLRLLHIPYGEEAQKAADDKAAAKSAAAVHKAKAAIAAGVVMSSMMDVSPRRRADVVNRIRQQVQDLHHTPGGAQDSGSVGGSSAFGEEQGGFEGSGLRPGSRVGSSGGSPSRPASAVGGGSQAVPLQPPPEQQQKAEGMGWFAGLAATDMLLRKWVSGYEPRS